MEKDFRGHDVLLKKYYESVADIKKFYIDGTSLFFAGNHGCGKTMISTSILKKAAQKNYTCLYTTLSDSVAALTQAPDDEKYIARKELLTVDFLVIDEFDNRFMSTEHSIELFGRTLENIFRTRSQNKMPTIMCTNSPNIVEAFSGAIKQSIDSLLKGYVKVVPILGSDFRKEKGK